MEQIRELIFYRHYFHDFFNQQTEKVKEKIDYVLFVLTYTARVPDKFLKHIEGQKGLYEIRIEVSNNIYHIFCCSRRLGVWSPTPGVRTYNLNRLMIKRPAAVVEIPGSAMAACMV